MPRPPRSPLFPYTTLFRSIVRHNILHPGQLRRSDTMPVPSGVFTQDRKSTRLNSSHVAISYAVFCLKKKILKHLERTKRRHITQSSLQPDEAAGQSRDTIA